MTLYALCRHEPQGPAATSAGGAPDGRPIAIFTAGDLAVTLVETEVRPPAAMDVVIDRAAGRGGTLHALRYPIRPGMADIAEQVFRTSGDPPLTMGGTRLLRTTVYRRGEDLVRVFAIEGDVEELVEGLARSVEVHDVGRRMSRLFEGSYDFTDPDGLRAFFRDNLMATIDPRPAAEAIA
jgi:hypothetical protein